MKLNVREIKRQMLRQYLKQKDLADNAGLSRQTVNVILSRGSCSADSGHKLANALGVDIEAIWKED